jgi:prepilin-type N-terminal cleavage/methylation domain-containing protein
MMRNRQKGFSLIELLIVVAIILIIAAIAIPNLLRSRMSAYEASAVGSLRTLNTSAITYASVYGNGFPPTLASMGTPHGGANAAATCDAALLIADDLTTGTKSGYVFVYTMTNPNATAPQGCASPGGNSYTITATPLQVGTTGQRMFFTDQSAVIRFDPTGAGASAASSPLQ